MKKIVCLALLTLIASWNVFAQSKEYTWNLELGGRVDVSKGTAGGEFNVATTHGVQFQDGFFMGGGAGLSPLLHSHGLSVPIFAEARYSIPGLSIQPFVACRGGLEYTFGNKMSEGLDITTYFLSPSIGIDFDSFFVRFAYWLQGGGQPEHNGFFATKFQQVGLSFGYTF